MGMKKYKILYCDLDGTLIETTDGTMFPQGIWDMKLKLNVLTAIKELEPEYVFIVTNQGGIEKGFVNESHFLDKMKYIASSIVEFCNISHVNFLYCPLNDKNNRFRKPNTAMLTSHLTFFADNPEYPFKKEDMLMIGDASGKPGQFSDTDKRTAENFGIDYFDVDDFINEVFPPTDK